MEEEIRRQIFHLFVGIATILAIFYLGRGMMIGAVFFTIIIGTLLINATFLGKRMKLVEWFEERFERKDVLFPGWGAACYATGSLIPLVFLTDVNQIAAVIFILAVGDSFATIIGKFGKIRVPHNKKKTLEGAFGFLLSSLPAYYFVGNSIVPLAIVGTIVEIINFRIDDNLTIPIAGTIFFLVI